ncbi:uncharacterized protein B0H18DRAFT_1118215 [Fomitopsis serialis]|uniref:uncharacterized protein n=1 Tax=Fomitopsis serialis TaxID=139415 RepID=UPI002008786D|nr:uncharacterized protein B0H18DRAFT_1118215 [Neoantrodia serialis]KAH9928207.1 hypothetical protein B0H18DRAFT_1118215 [Neoantrodia serialis]
MHGVAFVPRPFPPPALADVPIEYIIAQLRQLAPHYWRKPETSDCTIVVPLDTTNQAACSPTLGDAAEDTCSPPGDVPSLLGFSRQQEEEPAPRPGPRMVMQLHMDYLCAHSTLIRGFMSGASPFELMETTASSTLPLHPEAPTPGFPDSRRSSFSLPVPQFPCMLPSPPTHPSVYLPVPDPASFRLLVHYVYFGSTSFIEDALDDGTLSWEGLARNVEYLGMGAEIKVFLGRWYGRWRHGHGPAEYTSDSDSDSDMDMELRREREYDSDTDQELELPPKDMSAATSPTVFDPDDEYRKVDDDEIMKSSEPSRGRKRTPRRLVHSWSEPGLDSSVKEQLRTVRCRSK